MKVLETHRYSTAVSPTNAHKVAHDTVELIFEAGRIDCAIEHMLSSTKITWHLSGPKPDVWYSRSEKHNSYVVQLSYYQDGVLSRVSGPAIVAWMWENGKRTYTRKEWHVRGAKLRNHQVDLAERILVGPLELAIGYLGDEVLGPVAQHALGKTD